MLKTHQKFFEAASRYLQVLRVGRADFFLLWVCGSACWCLSRFLFFAGVCLSLVPDVFFFLDVRLCPALPTRRTYAHHTHALLG